MGFIINPFFGSVAAPITPSDPDTQGWWKATDLIVANTVIGDKLDATTNKTSAASPNFNLFPYSGGSGLTPNISDDLANYLTFSENLTSANWGATNFTKNSATTGTFTAMNGNVVQLIRYGGSGETWTVRFRCRAVTGNTSLFFLHTNSATGAGQALVVTGVLAEYTFTFLSPAAVSEISIGIQDQNAAGFGQIEVTEWQAYRTEHTATYAPALAAIQYSGKRGGISVYQSRRVNQTLFSTQSIPARTNPTPYTIYMAAYLRWFGGVEQWIANNMAPAIWGAQCGIETANKRMVSYVNVAPFARQYGPNNEVLLGWGIFTYIFNGASSSMRYNDNVATAGTHPVTTPNAELWEVGGESFGGAGTDLDIHETIIRHTADNTATQDLFITYLAAQVGLTL